MYAAYFGLTEPPFSIAPDPRYLYMSVRHREAMAHLLYGIDQGGGFVQLTGEVGTGKTTLCRLLLSNLPDNVEVALILNPRIHELELLQAICDELRIDYLPTARGQDLLSRLNKHLLTVHASGRRTVLIVDESQNLAREVLEQIRLLTNLETTKQKLLQIILIGQPELVEILAGPNLRQLSQRVTARYHLLPLSQAETAAYIVFRLSIAGRTEPLFTKGAMRRVFRLSKGIPRLINVICDRALLGAYGRDSKMVDSATVKQAAREVLGDSSGVRRFGFWARWVTGLALVALVAAGVVLRDDVLAVVNHTTGKWLTPHSGSDSQPVTNVRSDAPVTPVSAPRQPPITQEPPIAQQFPIIQDPTTQGMEEVERSTTPGMGVVERRTIPGTGEVERRRRPKPRMPEPIDDGPFAPDLALRLEIAAATRTNRAAIEGVALEGVLAGSAHGYRDAVRRLVELWGGQSDLVDNCASVGRVGLQCLAKSGDWASLSDLNRPAVLTLSDGAGDTPRYLVVAALEGDTVVADVSGRAYRFPRAEIDPHWNGIFTLLWRPPLTSAGSADVELEWLQQAMAQWSLRSGDGLLPGSGAATDPDRLRDHLKAFQRQHHLAATGVLEVDTIIRLNSVLNGGDIPLLAN